jgi:hypothetical protein
MKRTAYLGLLWALFSRQVTSQAGFTPLPYSFIQPANHSCVLQEKSFSCPEQDPTQVRTRFAAWSSFLLNDGNRSIHAALRLMVSNCKLSLAEHEKLNGLGFRWPRSVNPILEYIHSARSKASGRCVDCRHGDPCLLGNVD